MTDEAKAMAAKWAHPELLKIWTIISIPDWDEHEGKPVIKEEDIDAIANAVMALNREFNHPEIKALVQHLAKDGE